MSIPHTLRFGDSDFKIQRDLANTLKNQLRPKMEIEEPRQISSVNGLLFNSEVSNVGGSIAKEVIGVTNVVIGPQEKEFENMLFGNLYKASHGHNNKSQDVLPALEGKYNQPVRGLLLVSLEDFRRIHDNQVLYLVTLISYKDEAGNSYHTEKCVFLKPGALDTFCDGHNFYH